MATATATISINAFPKGHDVTQRRLHQYGTIAIQASTATYAAGGLALAFTNEVTGSLVPQDVDVKSVAGSGYIYQWNKSSNKLQIFVQGAAATDPLAEMADALAIPAGVSGDTIVYHAEFLKAV